ncbi:sodium-coupled monocarboxylate transporter 1-like isoform X1 [Bradysia coprophila]|uniref:sodium-coupled monocarboxylate transporter 1-like isoform X1 n=1 Tax=Bradysia coprophila TaxID=38358 RepID=UPI00187D935A|nr:sodium-coupled monocarboxylate transporter 1-like isoform X1 [Bradysia coprophila]
MNNNVDVTDIKLNVKDVKSNLQHFDWIDYGVFLFMLISCAAVGVYFGFIDKNRKRRLSASNATEIAQEYLLGGRRMTVVPVAMSLVASWISGIALLGLVTEMYTYGTQYLFVIFALILAGLLTSYVYMPVFHDLRLQSCFEYLEKRFDKRIRLFGSVLYSLHTITFLPVVIYVPALAFNQVTGIDIYIITPFVCAICIFYTLVGGIKAVVWTDCIQTFMMIGTMLIVIGKGTVDANGFGNIWNTNWAGGRLVFPELTLDPKERHSTLALLVGGTTFLICSLTFNQGMVQRYLALPTVRKARYALSIYIFTTSLLIAICCYAGLIVFTLYSQCDPLKTKLISAPDQLLPLFVMDSLGEYPGTAGLFIAGIFSAALSTLSTSLNSMAAVVLEDFYKPFVRKPLTERETTFLMKGVVFLVGIVSTTLVFVVAKLGTVLQLQVSIGGITAGPVVGAFTMGMLMPWVKRKGAFYGTVTGLIGMSWLLYKAQSDLASGDLTFPKKPVYTNNCSYSFASDACSNQTRTEIADDGSFKIHHVSYLFYTIIGAAITIVTSTIVSLILDNGYGSDPMLFSPIIRKFITIPQHMPIVAQDRNEKDCTVHVHTFALQDNKVQ